MSVPALSEKDTEDLRWALHLGVDFIALSFVRSAADAEDVRAIMREEGIFVPVIAKIEKPQAIDNIDEIVDAFDGLMVARGDLGRGVPARGRADPPEADHRQGPPQRQARHRRDPDARVDDHRARADPRRGQRRRQRGARRRRRGDAVRRDERGGVPHHRGADHGADRRVHRGPRPAATWPPIDWQPHTRGGIIAKAAAEVAEAVGAKFLVAFTVSGDSAKRLSRYRGPIPILAFTPQARTRSQLALTWGVETFQGAEVEHTDEMVRQVDEALLHIGRVKEGDLVVIIAGSPPGIPGSTNALRIHRMGDAINGVAPAYRRPR